MTVENDKIHARNKKKYSDIKESDRPGILANKICQTIFHATELVKRTKVQKDIIKYYKVKMAENILAGSHSEAFAYATSLLIEKKRMTWTLELAERTIDFTNFLKASLKQMDDEMYDYLENVSYLISNSFLSELERSIADAEDNYEYGTMKAEMAGTAPPHYTKRTDIKVTKRAVRAYMRRVKLDPRVLSRITMELSKLKSSYLNKSRQFRSRSNFFRF